MAKLKQLMVEMLDYYQVGHTYAVFRVDYEPDIWVEVSNFAKLDAIIKDKGQYGEYLGVFKCVKK